MLSRGYNLQDSFLNTLRQDQVPVAIYLVNGIKLQGQIDAFDQYVIMLKSNITQMVYKHAISTIVPVFNIRYLTEEVEPQLDSMTVAVIEESEN